MLVYQTPVISTVRQEPFQSQLQYQPDCFGVACRQFLEITGIDCCGPAEIQVQFFLPGRTDLSAPTGCIIIAEENDGDSYNGTSCSYFLDASCAEGQVWEVDCSFPDELLTDSGFNQAFISCDGELSSVCSGGGAE